MKFDLAQLCDQTKTAAFFRNNLKQAYYANYTPSRALILMCSSSVRVKTLFVSVSTQVTLCNTLNASLLQLHLCH